MARARARPSKRRIEKFEVKAPYNSVADPIPKEKRTKLGDLGDSRIDEVNDSGAIDADLTNEYMEKRVAFCCYQCFCPEEIKQQIPIDDPFIQSSIEGLYHRRCCHKVIEPDINWASPFEIASEELQLEEEVLHHVMTLPELEVQCKIAMRNQSAMYNADELPGTTSFCLRDHSIVKFLSLTFISFFVLCKDCASLLLTSDLYIENQKHFQKIPKSEHAMVVLVRVSLLFC